MENVKWTFVQIKHINNTAGWQVPDILRDGNIRYFEDALTALQFAEWRCAQFNKQHPHGKKVPVLNSVLHYQKKARVEIGSKARERLGYSSSSITVPVRNVFVLKNPNSTALVPSTRAFGQIVRNGETQSVMNRDSFYGGYVPDNMRWTNLGVLEMKRLYQYPANTFFPTSERGTDGFLAPLTAPTTLSSALSSAGENISKIAKSMASSFNFDYQPKALELREIPRGFAAMDMGNLANQVAQLVGRGIRTEVQDDLRPPTNDPVPDSIPDTMWSSYTIRPEDLERYNNIYRGRWDWSLSSEPQQHSVDVNARGGIVAGSFSPLAQSDALTQSDAVNDIVEVPTPEGMSSTDPALHSPNFIPFGDLGRWAEEFRRTYHREAIAGTDYMYQDSPFGYRVIGVAFDGTTDFF